jgi:hypothetical protein
MSKAILIILLLTFLAAQCCGQLVLDAKNWEKDPTLKNVVPKGVKGVTAFLKKTYPKKVGKEKLKLKKVLKVEQIDVAGTNYKMDMELVAGNQVFRCTRVVVHQPLTCSKESHCLKYLSGTGSYDHNCSIA